MDSAVELGEEFLNELEDKVIDQEKADRFFETCERFDKLIESESIGICRVSSNAEGDIILSYISFSIDGECGEAYEETRNGIEHTYNEDDNGPLWYTYFHSHLFSVIELVDKVRFSISDEGDYDLFVRVDFIFENVIRLNDFSIELEFEWGDWEKYMEESEDMDLSEHPLVKFFSDNKEIVDQSQSGLFVADVEANNTILRSAETLRDIIDESEVTIKHETNSLFPSTSATLLANGKTITINNPQKFCEIALGATGAFGAAVANDETTVDISFTYDNVAKKIGDVEIVPKKIKHYRYDVVRADYKYGIDEHPQIQMRELGFDVIACESYPEAECWIFRVGNDIKSVPDYLTEIKGDYKFDFESEREKGNKNEQ